MPHNNYNNNITKLLQQYQLHSGSTKAIGTHLSLIQRLRRSHVLKSHTGCVNCASWSTNGSLLVSGSDDRRLVIWSVEKDFAEIHSIETDHMCNIFCAEFMNDNRSIVSGSADGEIRLHNLEGAGQETIGGLLLYGRRDMILKVAPDLTDPNNIFWASSKSSSIAFVDLREAHTKQRGVNLVQTPNLLVSTMSFNPLNPHMMALACADPIIRLFDTRTRSVMQSFAVPSLLKQKGQKRSIFNEISTSGVSFNNKNEFAVSFCGHDIYLFDATRVTPTDELCTDVLRSYTGHRNVRTFLKDVRFIGLNSEYVASGSDCGNVFIWDTKSTEVVQLLESDISVANGVAPHPTHQSLLVSWGIESKVNVWEANAPDPTYVPKIVNKTVENNTTYVEPSILPPFEFMRSIGVRRARRQQAAEEAATANTSESTSSTTVNSSNNNNNATETTTTTSNPNNNNTTAIGTPTSTTSSSSNTARPPADATVELYTEQEFRMCINQHANPSAITIARVLRSEGNESFRERDLHFSYLAYKHAVDVLEGVIPAPNNKPLIRQEIIPCLLNRAAVALSTKEYSQVIADCTKVIAIYDPNNVKAHYRRGMAYFKIGSHDEAMTDLQKASTLDPSDSQAKRAIVDLRKAMEESKKKEAKMFGGLFK